MILVCTALLLCRTYVYGFVVVIAVVFIVDVGAVFVDYVVFKLLSTFYVRVY